MDGWMDGQKEMTDEKGLVNRNRWMDGWMDEWMDGYINERDG